MVLSELGFSVRVVWTLEDVTDFELMLLDEINRK
jgi:hypothetical protein